MLDIVHYDLSPFQSPLGSKIRHTVLPFEKEFVSDVKLFLKSYCFDVKLQMERYDRFSVMNDLS